MKILGLNKQDGLKFIVELSDDELANLCLDIGSYSYSDFGVNNSDALVGKELEVHKMWGMLYKYSQYKNNIEEVRERLNSISDDLAFVKPFTEERKEE